MADAENDFAKATEIKAQMTDMILEQISKLAVLHQEAVLTDEEFSAKKSELLSRL